MLQAPEACCAARGNLFAWPRAFIIDKHAGFLSGFENLKAPSLRGLLFTAADRHVHCAATWGLFEARLLF
jgi:hypothetical protein